MEKAAQADFGDLARNAVFVNAGASALNGVFAGVMARLFTSPNHSAGPGTSENHVNYWKVQNGTTRRHRNDAQ